MELAILQLLERRVSLPYLDIAAEINESPVAVRKELRRLLNADLVNNAHGWWELTDRGREEANQWRLSSDSRVS